MTSRFDESRHLSVARLRKAGLSYAEIGRQIGLSRERVRIIAGTDTVSKKRTDKDSNGMMMTISEVARLLNVHINTIRRWSNMGVIQNYRFGSRGDRRFRRVDVEKLVRQCRVPKES